ncbi:glycosyltransferase [Roseivirga sp.]|uniref:glycosyltransferase n=1 Tax=Roseivirga sp. TaxID=1964215 RepID=UPI003B8C3B81
MSTIIYIIASIIICYLVASGTYQLVLAIASKRPARRICKFDGRKRNMLVLVPAYKEDKVILETTKRNMNLRYKYPKTRFDYVVISDGLKDSTNEKLKTLGAKVLKVNFDKSTKVKSLQAAITRYDKAYEGVIILDADNVVNMNLLFKASHYLSCGYKAIQGLRSAANAQTSIALMDGLSEAANTEMLCKGANRLGFSSKLSGSGMVFDYQLFKSLIFQLKAIGGFDKELELALTKKSIYIKYAHDIVVLDEKVANTQAFAKQRGRWLQAQYTFLFKSIKGGFKSLIKGNFDHFHKVMQLALPPRVLAPVLLFIAIAITALCGAYFLTAFSIVGLSATLISYLLALPTIQLMRNVFAIIRSIPKLIWGAIKAIGFMKASKTQFLHTEHKLASS